MAPWYGNVVLCSRHRTNAPFAVGQDRRHGYAGGSDHRIFLLYSMDSFHGTFDIVCIAPLLTRDIAIRGRRSPTPKSFPAPCLGHSNSRYTHIIGLRGGRVFLGYGHDQEQPEEGCESEGSRRKEDQIDVHVG